MSSLALMLDETKSLTRSLGSRFRVLGMEYSPSPQVILLYLAIEHFWWVEIGGATQLLSVVSKPWIAYCLHILLFPSALILLSGWMLSKHGQWKYRIFRRFRQFTVHPSLDCCLEGSSSPCSLFVVPLSDSFLVVLVVLFMLTLFLCTP
jgi:hypothetical protein